MPENDFTRFRDMIIRSMPPGQSFTAPPAPPGLGSGRRVYSPPQPPMSFSPAPQPGSPGGFDILTATALPRFPLVPEPQAAPNPVATALVGQPLTVMPPMVRSPQMVKAAPIGPAFDPKDPSVGELTGILFNETRGQTPGPGAPGMDALRGAMGNAVMNGYEQGVPKKGFTGPSAIPGPAMGKILGGILNSHADQRDTDAFNSSFNAALGALNRSAPPSAGPGSGTYFNGRSDARATPNTTNPIPLPFAGTMGPYNNGKLPNWAFFYNPKSMP